MICIKQVKKFPARGANNCKDAFDGFHHFYMAHPSWCFSHPERAIKRILFKNLNPHPWGPAGKQTDFQIGAKHEKRRFTERCETRNNTKNTSFQHLSFLFFSLLLTPTPCSKTYVLKIVGGSPKHLFQHSPGR